MLNHSALRRPLFTAQKIAPPLVFSAAASTAARASTLSLSTGCSASGATLKCRLGELLGFLSAAAAVLGFLLIIVVALAIHSYRASRKDGKTGL